MINKHTKTYYNCSEKMLRLKELFFPKKLTVFEHFIIKYIQQMSQLGIIV